MPTLLVMSQEPAREVGLFATYIILEWGLDDVLIYLSIEHVCILSKTYSNILLQYFDIILYDRVDLI